MSDVNLALSPAETVEANLKAAEGKAALPLGKMFLLAILAGAFIAFGAEASSLAAHTVEGVGMQRFITGCVFPIGLILVVLLGAELFTGNNLMVAALLDKRIGLSKLLRNWGIVWVGNLVGSLLIVVLVYATGQLGYSDSGLAAYTIKIANAKATMGCGSIFVSGILCNILVCGAVLLATSSKATAGKILACWFIIMAFVVSGFEHCVANMYYVPAGLVAMLNPDYAAAALATYGIDGTTLTILGCIKNLVFATLGNVVGGGCLGAALWAGHHRKSKQK